MTAGPRPNGAIVDHQWNLDAVCAASAAFVPVKQTTSTEPNMRRIL